MWNYIIIGPKGAIDFRVTSYTPEIPTAAGLEIHRRSPSEYQKDYAPSFDECHILKCPCWHDGTTLYAEDHLLPLWRECVDSPSDMFKILLKEMERF